MKKLFGLLLIPLLSACDLRQDTPDSIFTIAPNTPDSFIQFLNPQASFAAGEYELLLLPSIANQGNYSGQLQLVSSVQSEAFDISGNWESSVDVDWETTVQAPHEFTLEQAGGLTLAINCSDPCSAYVIKNGLLFAVLNSDSQNDENLIAETLAANQLNSLEYATAYYTAVDPNNLRTTLTDWKSVNGFDSGEDVHVIFRDSKDLGYGRDMYMKQHDDGRVSFYVNNFVVRQGDGDPSNYGPLNLMAAIDHNESYLSGTNAIEYSPIEYADGETPADPDTDAILKFFIFGSKDENGEQQRLIQADLDGRGVKYMPTICLLCHGARLLPLNKDGTFNTLSLKAAKPNQLEVASFEFMEQGPYSKAQQESAIRQVNLAVHSIFSSIGDRDETESGYWDAQFAIDIAAGRYGGDFSSEVFIEDNIPTGWQQTDDRPQGIETLYKQVIEPHCISCHSLRSFNAGNDENLNTYMINGKPVKTGTAINFSNYEKFISYSDIIIDYVYRRGVMPLSLRNYEQFWSDPDGAPSLLAAYLPNFDVLNDVGKIEEAGKAVARFGKNRQAKSPVLLDASGSYFADEYLWAIIDSPIGSIASLSKSTGAITELTADTNGDYTVQLTVNNEYAENNTSSSVETVVITIDNSLPKHGSELTFANDVRPILQNTLFNLRTCTTCHFSGSNIEGIPVYYDDSNEQLYRDIRSRVDFKDADNSILIRKPTRLQHGGGKLIDVSTQSGNAIYSTLMDWILHGAPCGDGVWCDNEL